MVEESTAIAESSPAPVEATPSLEVPRNGTPEYQKWRETGEITVAKPSGKEDSAPPDAAKVPTDDAADSAATNKQEIKPKKRDPEVEARFKGYADRVKQLEQELEQARTKTPAESSPAKPPAQPQNYQEWRKAFKPKEWVNQYVVDHPEAELEDAFAAMQDHQGDMRDQFRQIEQQRDSQIKEYRTKADQARTRYENFDQAVEPFVDKFVGEPSISPLVKQLVNDSDVFADLAFVLAGDDKFMEIAKDTRKAIKYIVSIENQIEERLAGKTEAERNDKGQFQKTETPAKRGPESAPAPPLEIGSRGNGPMDESDRALQAMERGDPKAFAAFREAENRKDMAKRSGR